MRKRERVVVVGAGVAGLRTAERLRELGFNDEIVMVGAEQTPPYHRPPLSKQLLCGKLRPSDLLLPSYTELDATWRLATPVLGMDSRRQVVHLPGGEELRYDGLVIATGVEPRHLPGVPVHDPRVHYLHTVDEALALRQNLQRTRRPLVVLGAGFIGCELASTAHHLGGEVTIVGRSKVLLGKAVGPDLAKRITELHGNNGVNLALGEKVLHWLPQQQGVVLNLSSGKVIVAGAVVVCAGSVPAVNWLRGSGLTVDDGVLCEPTCHVVGRGDIVAAGDVARWPNLRFNAQPRRVEHWLNAIEMGRHAAESLLAGRAAARPFTPIPRFWSEQHGMRIQGAGIPALGEDTVQLLPSTRPDQSVTGFVAGGRLVGLVALNSPQALLSWTAELDRQTHPRLTAPVPDTVATITPANDSLPNLPRPGRAPTPPRQPESVPDLPRPAAAAPGRAASGEFLPNPYSPEEFVPSRPPAPPRRAAAEFEPSLAEATEFAPPRPPAPNLTSTTDFVPSLAGGPRRRSAGAHSFPDLPRPTPDPPRPSTGHPSFPDLPRPGFTNGHPSFPDLPRPVPTGGLHARTERAPLSTPARPPAARGRAPGPVTPPPFPAPIPNPPNGIPRPGGSAVPAPPPPPSRPVPRMDPKPATRQWTAFSEPAELEAPANGISRQLPRRRRSAG